MNGATMLVEFDPTVRRQLEEAKTKYREARLAGRTIADLSGREVRHFAEVVDGFKVLAVIPKAHEFAMRIFDETGDRRVIWNARDPSQVAEAARLFQDYVAKGWKAYTVTPDGVIARRIRAFDADSQEVVFDDTPVAQKLQHFTKAIPARPAPRTLRQKLTAFAESFKEVHLLPKTYPG
jgi:hypothetical protein